MRTDSRNLFFLYIKSLLSTFPDYTEHFSAHVNVYILKFVKDSKLFC